jgi:hypothetical protein
MQYRSIATARGEGIHAMPSKCWSWQVLDMATDMNSSNDSTIISVTDFKPVPAEELASECITACRCLRSEQLPSCSI